MSELTNHSVQYAGTSQKRIVKTLQAYSRDVLTDKRVGNFPKEQKFKQYNSLTL